MDQPAIVDQEIRALQEWLRSAWQQLGSSSLTAFTRRELRNQMKQCTADLRSYLQTATMRPEPVKEASRTFSKPELRILA